MCCSRSRTPVPILNSANNSLCEGNPVGELVPTEVRRGPKGVKVLIRDWTPVVVGSSADCGLKTRQWPEVKASMKNLVEAARRIREEFKEQLAAEVLTKDEA